MPLAEFFRNLAQQMLVPGGIFENVPFAGVYTRMGNPSYDPVTGIVTEAPTTYPVTGVKDRVDVRKVDNVNIFPNDEVFYVSGKTFTDAGLLLPNKPDDTMTFPDGRWNVVRIDTDPVNAVMILLLRKP